MVLVENKLTVDSAFQISTIVLHPKEHFKELFKGYESLNPLIDKLVAEINKRGTLPYSQPISLHIRIPFHHAQLYLCGTVSGKIDITPVYDNESGIHYTKMKSDLQIKVVTFVSNIYDLEEEFCRSYDDALQRYSSQIRAVNQRKVNLLFNNDNNDVMDTLPQQIPPQQPRHVLPPHPQQIPSQQPRHVLPPHPQQIPTQQPRHVLPPQPQQIPPQQPRQVLHPHQLISEIEVKNSKLQQLLKEAEECRKEIEQLEKQNYTHGLTYIEIGPMALSYLFGLMYTCILSII